MLILPNSLFPLSIKDPIVWTGLSTYGHVLKIFISADSIHIFHNDEQLYEAEYNISEYSIIMKSELINILTELELIKIKEE